jgi:hypothetical protein
MSLVAQPEIEDVFLTANTEVLNEEDWSAQDRLLGNTARLGVPWTASALAGWVGKNLASGVVSAIGGMAFGEALKAIGLGGPDVGAMLQDISNRLAAVEQTVKEIKVLVLQLLEHLETLRLSMDQSFLEGEIRTAFSQIDAAYGTPDSRQFTHDLQNDAGRPAPSFMELLTSLRKTKTPQELKQYADDFVAAEGRQWNLVGQIQTIHNALTEKTGQGESLLTRWTAGLLNELNLKKIDYDRAYRTLESYFLQAVAKQLTAVSMHCFALGGDASRIDYFVRIDFGAKMKRQTAEFLRCTEHLLLSRIRLLKVPSVFTPEQSGEFPHEMDPIFLRADLICASLNLVGNQQQKANAKEAIAGIYGRVLARSIDVADGQGPAIALPGYAASRGARGTETEPLHVISTLHPVEFSNDGNIVKLNDYAKSHAVVVRYYWPWPAQLSPQNVAIDPRMRGGVKPAYFNVFSDKDWPLAAGFTDFSRLLLGVSHNVAPRVPANTLFPPPDAHSVLKQGDYFPGAVHPLARPETTTLAWRFAHSAPAAGTWLRKVQHHLFTYAGKPAKMRLTVNVRCEVEHTCSKKQGKFMEWGDNDMNARMTVSKSGSGPSHTFYNSEFEGGGALFLIHQPPNYKRSLDSWAGVEFEVSEGEWLFTFDFKNWIGERIRGLSYFDGWKIDTLIFEIKGFYVEWL